MGASIWQLKLVFGLWQFMSGGQLKERISSESDVESRTVLDEVRPPPPPPVGLEDSRLTLSLSQYQEQTIMHARNTGRVRESQAS